MGIGIQGDIVPEMAVWNHPSSCVSMLFHINSLNHFLIVNRVNTLLAPWYVLGIALVVR
ncbi:hypothetical protein BDQ94DRAFT_153661 [Aspergillus welwitschiae]|uniref:Uncharacterized protein n=1 Tax=Aspergillus welwitschiae TaxID=1341132 RepID=A0A3F3PL70_9EURO|nr:hypothetical protein BDQ94DRAFT_153661 [Aspergillus welwitschiae]RDH27598.1 hypothetical protein BDQ94DRAFT_153661 [Aspergillus welwitschiae]